MLDNNSPPVHSPSLAINKFELKPIAWWLQIATLVILGPIFLAILLKVKLGFWWPDFNLINQFWLNQSWMIAAQFLLGWLLAGLILKLDSAKSQFWYQSLPLTRSVSFLLVLFVLGIFVMTSTDVWMGMALILSLWSQLSIEVFLIEKNSAKLAEVFLHDIQPAARLKLAEKLAGKLGILMSLVIVFFLALSLI